ncbi:MAG: cytochrome b, partial [Gammaproteobacteria bacterium]
LKSSHSVRKSLWEIRIDPKNWERVAARFVHILLAFAAVLIPATGFLFTASNGEPISIYGLFEIPDIGNLSKSTRNNLYDTHYYIAYGCAAVVALHAIAALKHHFIDKNNTLRRMLF